MSVYGGSPNVHYDFGDDTVDLSFDGSTLCDLLGAEPREYTGGGMFPRPPKIPHMTGAEVRDLWEKLEK